MPIRPWIVLESKTILSNEWLSVRVDKCRVPDLDLVLDNFYVIEKKDSVYIVPVTKDYRVILVKQYRHACGQVIFELPAGYINKGETPQQAAERELLEETGYIAKGIDHLGMLYVSPAVLTNKSYIFLCRDLEHQKEPLRDGSEEIELTSFKIDELVTVGIADHVLVDAISVSAILLAYQKLRGI